MSLDIKKFAINWLSWNRVKIIVSTKTLNGLIVYIAVSAIAVKAIPVLQAYGLDIDLPFNWVLLFWAAISYVLGYVIYHFFCPSFVKEYPSFSKLTSSGFTYLDYLSTLEDMKENKILLDNSSEPGLSYEKIIHLFSLGPKIQGVDKPSPTYIKPCIENISISIQSLDITKSSNLYNLIYNSYSQILFVLSSLSISLFLFSYFAILFVLFENIKSVIMHLY